MVNLVVQISRDVPVDALLCSPDSFLHVLSKDCVMIVAR